jgi:hypothetical protein
MSSSAIELELLVMKGFNVGIAMVGTHVCGLFSPYLYRNKVVEMLTEYYRPCLAGD